MNYPDSSTANTTAKKPRFSSATRALLLGLALVLPGTAAQAAEPIPGVDIIVQKKPSKTGDPIIVAPTGTDGAYQFKGLAAGDYDLSVGRKRVQTLRVGSDGGIKGVLSRQPNGTASITFNGQVVVVPDLPGERAAPGLPSPPSQAGIAKAGEAPLPGLASPGTPIQGTEIGLEGDPGSIKVSAKTDSTGAFHFDKLPAGNFAQTMITNLISGPCLPPYLCEYIWNVQALNREGKPIGGNNGVSFGNNHGQTIPLSEEKTKASSIRGNEQHGYQPPQNIAPENGAVLSEIDIKKPITSRWTPVVPRPQEPVTYQLKVWQLMQGQNGAQALATNQPIITKDVDNHELTLLGLSPQLLTVGAAGGKLMKGPDGSLSIFDRWGKSVASSSKDEGIKAAATPFGFGSGNTPGVGPVMSAGPSIGPGMRPSAGPVMGGAMGPGPSAGAGPAGPGGAMRGAGAGRP